MINIIMNIVVKNVNTCTHYDIPDVEAADRLGTLIVEDNVTSQVVPCLREVAPDRFRMYAMNTFNYYGNINEKISLVDTDDSRTYKLTATFKSETESISTKYETHYDDELKCQVFALTTKANTIVFDDLPLYSMLVTPL